MGHKRLSTNCDALCRLPDFPRQERLSKGQDRNCDRRNNRKQQRYGLSPDVL
jgi:hypothetical protein